MWEKEVLMKRFSLFLSYAFCITGLIVMLFFAVAAPIFGLERIATVSLDRQNAVLAYLLSYLVIALVIVADICLFLLLRNIRRELIFTASSVTLLRIISWASILAGFIAFPLFFVFIREALFISFVALFLGVVLRVVKQVIAKATELKEENDATI